MTSSCMLLWYMFTFAGCSRTGCAECDTTGACIRCEEDSPHHRILGNDCHGVYKAVKLPWIFPGAPLTFNGAPRNIQGNLERYICTLHVPQYLWMISSSSGQLNLLILLTIKINVRITIPTSYSRLIIFVNMFRHRRTYICTGTVLGTCKV